MTESEIPDAIYQNINVEGCLDLKMHTEKPQPPPLTGRVSVKSRKQRAVEVSLCLLCALLLTAVIALCVCFTIQREYLLTHITNLTEEREQLLTNISKLTKERDQLRNDTNILPLEQDMLADNFTWIRYNHSFYYISSVLKSWNDSRQDCQRRGADLAIIKSPEEYNFLQNVVNKYFWIGLTKIQGVWKWTDGTTFTNASTTDNYNCAAVAAGGYFSFTCDSNNGWICEKTYHY